MIDETHETSAADELIINHTPVMVDEVMRLLAPKAGQTIVDCTVGLGGHAAIISDAVGPTGTVVGFDHDANALATATERLKAHPARFIPINAGFDSLRAQLEKLELRADGVLADLGIGSHQLSDENRGFSFMTDAPLDMRFDRDRGATAADLLARLSERELADLIYQFGEEPLSRKIARKLAEARRQEPIRSTAQLARLVGEAYGRRAKSSRRHPATRTFMALRIAVNDELGALHAFLEQVSDAAELIGRGEKSSWLNAGARVAVISFHSLEDRPVKHCFADLARGERAYRLTRKPLTALDAECARNPRARSAKLRAVMVDAPHAWPAKKKSPT